MDLHELITGGSEYIAANRPQSPDMDRITEIVLEMKAITQEAKDFDEHSAVWKKYVEHFVDFDALAWQALNVAFDVFNIRTGYDLNELRQSKRKNAQFIGTLQAFYDGFLLGAIFQERGGHRENQ